MSEFGHLSVNERAFIAIPVIEKSTGRLIMIKNYRFNPEYHEHPHDSSLSMSLDAEVKNLHKDNKIIINSEDLVDKTETNAIDGELVEETVGGVKTEEKASADEPVEEAPKRRGRPKKSNS